MHESAGAAADADPRMPRDHPREELMTAYNVVRFRIREGMDQAFLDAHRDGKAAWPGLSSGCIIKTGEQTYVLIGEWPNMTTLAGARGRMIATLDTFRHSLEGLGPGLGVTDAVSGDVVLALT
jgi:hypothetical protein